MGITSEEFFQNAYKVMFAPDEFFDNENMKVSVRLGAVIIIAAAALNKYTFSITDNTVYTWTFIFPLLLSIVCALLMWLILALFFEYTAKIFNKDGNFSKFLYLSAAAVIPSVLFAPLCLLKQAGEAGWTIAVILSCLLYLRIFYLYVYALKSSYNITFARALMFVFLPLAAIVPFACRGAGFILEISRIFSI